MTETAFSRFTSRLDYPLYVVTTAAQGERSGCLIGFATQCSIHPPRFLACLSKKNHTFGLARHAEVLAVHRVEEDQKHIAELFGGETGDQVDKFRRLSWHEVHGVPVLDECACWFTGSILERLDLGDHVGYLLEPLEAEPGAPSSPLTFQRARDIEAGHKP